MTESEWQEYAAQRIAAEARDKAKAQEARRIAARDKWKLDHQPKVKDC